MAGLSSTVLSQQSQQWPPETRTIIPRNESTSRLNQTLALPSRLEEVEHGLTQECTVADTTGAPHPRSTLGKMWMDSDGGLRTTEHAYWVLGPDGCTRRKTLRCEDIKGPQEKAL